MKRIAAELALLGMMLTGACDRGAPPAETITSRDFPQRIESQVRATRAAQETGDESLGTALPGPMSYPETSFFHYVQRSVAEASDTGDWATLMGMEPINMTPIAGRASTTRRSSTSQSRQALMMTPEWGPSEETVMTVPADPVSRAPGY